MSDNSRRKLLKSIAAGSGAVIAGKSLPEKWSRPVVDSVLLPAHAITSLAQYTNIRTRGALENDSLLADAMDSLIPEAAAGDGEGRTEITCATQNPDGTYKVDGMIMNEKGETEVTAAAVQLGGSPVDMDRTKCGEFKGLGQVKVVLNRTFEDGGAINGYYLIGGAENRLNFYLKLGACSAPTCYAYMI